jgi:hypothetical protein
MNVGEEANVVCGCTVGALCGSEEAGLLVEPGTCDVSVGEMFSWPLLFSEPNCICLILIVRVSIVGRAGFGDLLCSES